MNPHPFAPLIAAAVMAVACASASQAAEPRRASQARTQVRSTPPPRARHARQVDVNDVAGRGAWFGCAAHDSSSSLTESPSLSSVYCRRPPVDLAESRSGVDPRRAA